MLVYDITNPKSFEQLDSWREEFLHQVGVVLLEVECCPAREGDLGRANTAFSVFDPRVRCRERDLGRANNVLCFHSEVQEERGRSRPIEECLLCLCLAGQGW